MTKDNLNKTRNLSKIIVILGPTASGKTEWGIRAAREFNGEVVSADSRQVYRHMNIGTAKPDGKWSPTVIPAKAGIQGNNERRLDSRFRGNDSAKILRFAQDDSNGGNDKLVYVVDGVAHHLMDVVAPDENFSLANFKQKAIIVINDILERGKLPIIVGGTGLYIQSIVDNLEIPRVAPDAKLRARLEQKTLDEQVAMLRKIDSESAGVIDLKNPRRVLRALEVAISSGESFTKQQKKGAPLYDALQIGIDWAREELYERINTRVDEQIKQGLVEETRGLIKRLADSSTPLHSTQNDNQDSRLRGNDNAVCALPSMSGIGYKQMGYYLRGEMTLSEAIELLKRDTRNYAKRQMTWFKRDERINWLSDYERASELVREFLK